MVKHRSPSSGKPRRLTNRNIAIIGGVFTIIGTIAAVVTIILPSDRNGQSPQQTSAGGCAQVGNNNTCSLQQQAVEIGQEAKDDQQLKELVARNSQNPPTPPGPWPFLVYNTADRLTGDEIGLKVKAAPSVEGMQTGSVASQSLVWADCLVINEFNPVLESSADVGPRWLLIHWPTNLPGSTFMKPSPNDPFLQYVYAGYTLPFTHNGQIPLCG